MKKVFYIFIFLILCIFTSQAQTRFKAGIKAGISTSQVEGDTYAGFNKFGFDGGATLKAKINEKWAAQFEILFIQKGSKHVGDANKGDLSFYLMELNYVEVPILFQYQQKKFTFEAGPGFGYLINSKEYDTNGEIYNAIPFIKKEISASIGINYMIYKNLGMTWRFTESLLPIRKYASGASFWFNPGQRNNVLAFTLTYTFGNDETE
ncbi:MAG: porin family protein [Bacteroidetes bacterium]|nr:porin family protein [Bacteroidota bacterium]